MKKSLKIILIIVGVIAIMIAGYFICFYRKTTDDNKKDLTIEEKLTLNDNEKEILSELVNINDKLLNPEPQEEQNTEGYLDEVKPTEPIALKDFCIKLYEARKKVNEDGEVFYLFDMETKGQDGQNARRIYVTQNGEIKSCTILESVYENALKDSENTEVEDGTINFGKDFIKALFDAVTQAINQMWDEADRYENVNYSNILSRV